MIVLGVDPSLKATGYGVVESVGRNGLRAIEAGVIESKQKERIQHKLNRIYSNIKIIIQRCQPDVLVLEKTYTHHQYHTTGMILGHVRGVICVQTARQNIGFFEYGVKEIRKSVTGKGNATKSYTQRIIANVLGIDEKKLTLDASDALAMAVGHIYLSCFNPPQL